MDDNDEHDTIFMQDEDKTLDTNSDEVKEEDDQELIIIPFKLAQSISEVSDDIRVCTNTDSSVCGSNIHGKLVRVNQPRIFADR